VLERFCTPVTIPLIRRDFLMVIGAPVRCKWGISIGLSRENARQVKKLNLLWWYQIADSKNTAAIFIAASGR
jgi:hypothetical protein